MPIRTPLTLLLILAEPCASATVIGSPTMASLPNSLLEYIIAFLILFFIWNFTSPKAHDLLHAVPVSHPIIGERAPPHAESRSFLQARKFPCFPFRSVCSISRLEFGRWPKPRVRNHQIYRHPTAGA